MPAGEAPEFDDLPLSERAIEAAHALGWRRPTPIQAAVVPHLAVGRDVIGRAETGSGKTGAYGLVLTDAVKAPGIQALVLAPTRELAQQIAKDLNGLAAGAPFRAVAVYGGVPWDEQLAQLRDPQATCVVATTGRLLDLLARKQVLLDHVRVVVIDEADRMLDLGFLPEVERILKLIPGGRQTALFTETLPKKVAQLAHQYMAHPREVEVGRQTPESAEHYRLDVASQDKVVALVGLLLEQDPRRALVFARTREGAQALANELILRGVPSLALHGDLTQPQREAALAALREGEARIVVATDVAGRGLDVPDITHVFNYDVPEDADQYVHRAGRTARAGKQGRVFTLVAENEGPFAKAAETAAKVKLRPYTLRIDGRVVTRAEHTSAKREIPGGYAKGVQRKKRPEPRPPRVREPDAGPQERDREFDLPPSRRKGREMD